MCKRIGLSQKSLCEERDARVRPMKSKLSRCLRKWADLIDPQKNPSTGISILVELDTTDAQAKLGKLIKSLDRVNQAASKVVF
jgi:hypothetical protein